jgi:DNA-binding LacI/PurR family transcriptional regulator
MPEFGGGACQRRPSILITGKHLSHLPGVLVKANDDAVSQHPLTSRQLASLIGVSQSAVSRAFTPGSSISADLRDRILKGAREFGYHPNAIASMLTTRRTNMVGIVVSDMLNPFYPALIERLTQGLQRAGMQSLLFNVAPGSRIEEQLVAIRTDNVDAVVVISATVLDERALRWATEGRRAIVLNRLSKQTIPTVCCDNVAGARAIVDHFHAIGRRRIGYVAGLTRSGVGMARYSAFTERLAELGMDLTGTASYEAYSYQAGARGALDLLQGRPDAIFFASDILALGGLDTLRRRKGISVPDDIAVAGFDDIPMASWDHYALTTCRQPLEEIADRTVNALVSTEAMPAKPILIPGKLIVRHSSVG